MSSLLPSKVSTFTPRDELTLRMSRPSSANSRLINGSGTGWSSGLSPSSTGRSTKFGFRSMSLKAFAMTAASAPENGAESLVRDMVDAPSCTSGEFGLLVPSPADTNAAVPRRGDWVAWLCACDIMGVDEPMEPRCESAAPRRILIRRMMKKMRIPVATKARKPRTTMTAIAQCGNDDPPPSFWTFPDPGPAVGVPCAELRLACDADDTDAREEDRDAAEEAEAADADDAAAAAEVEDIAAATESAKVVSGIVFSPTDASIQQNVTHEGR